MRMNDFLDRYIQGVPGSYYFCIEFPNGQQISGGQFYRIADARNLLINKLVTFLDDPELILHPKAAARAKK